MERRKSPPRSSRLIMHTKNLRRRLPLPPQRGHPATPRKQIHLKLAEPRKTTVIRNGEKTPPTKFKMEPDPVFTGAPEK